MLEDIYGHGGRAPQEAAVLFRSYGSGYDGSLPHMEHNQMSGARLTTSKLPYEYAGRDHRGSVLAIGGNSGEYPEYRSPYDHV